MSFNAPYALAMLPILIALIGWLHWHERRRARALHSFIGRSSVSERYRWMQHAGWSFASVLIVFALADPTWGYEVVPSVGRSSAVIFVVDVSRSMDVEDIRPSRLERAKQTLTTIIPLLDGTEFGLIVFAGRSEVYFPLTTDVFSTTRRIALINTYLQKG